MLLHLVNRSDFVVDVMTLLLVLLGGVVMFVLWVKGDGVRQRLRCRLV